MKHLPLLLLLTFIIGGCASSRRLSENVHQQDSVGIRVETRIEYVPDTVFIEIPAQTSERETADSTSHLENDYATSDARINPDGTLYHNLKTKPQKKPVEFEKPVERKDSVIYKKKTVTETESSPRPYLVAENTDLRLLGHSFHSCDYLQEKDFIPCKMAYLIIL